MSNYLGNLAASLVHPGGGVQPRLPGRFERWQAPFAGPLEVEVQVDGGAGGGGPAEERVAPGSDSVMQPRAAAPARTARPHNVPAGPAQPPASATSMESSEPATRKQSPAPATPVQPRSPAGQLSPPGRLEPLIGNMQAEDVAGDSRSQFAAGVSRRASPEPLDAYSARTPGERPQSPRADQALAPAPARPPAPRPVSHRPAPLLSTESMPPPSAAAPATAGDRPAPAPREAAHAAAPPPGPTNEPGAVKAAVEEAVAARIATWRRPEPILGHTPGMGAIAPRLAEPAASMPPPTAQARQAPAIRVTIGRVEVRAVAPAASPAPTAASRTERGRRRPGLSLDEYLARRKGGAP